MTEPVATVSDSANVNRQSGRTTRQIDALVDAVITSGRDAIWVDWSRNVRNYTFAKIQEAIEQRGYIAQAIRHDMTIRIPALGRTIHCVTVETGIRPVMEGRTDLVSVDHSVCLRPDIAEWLAYRHDWRDQPPAPPQGDAGDGQGKGVGE